MGLVLEPEEEAALFIYILDGCMAGNEQPGVKHEDQPHNYSSLFEEYNRSGCKVTIPAIIEKYGEVVNDKVLYRGHGVESWPSQPEKQAADRTIAPGMAGRGFFSVSWDILTAFSLSGDGCCMFEITLVNAKILDIATISFARSKEGGMYPAGMAERVEKERAERNDTLDYKLSYDRECLVLGGGEFTPLGKPVKYKEGTKLVTDMYLTTYTGKKMGGRRRRTVRRRKMKMSRKRKTTSS